MSTQTQDIELQQLTATVALLAESLARSERRHAHIARSLRWGGLMLVSLLVAATALVADRTGLAFAAQGDLPETATLVDALNRIDRNLAMFGMMGGVLEQLAPAIGSAISENTDVRATVDDYLKRQSLELTDANRKAYAAPVVVNSAVTTMVDTVVLMGRIRGDSNAFRELIGGPTPALRGLEQELQRLNVALAAVPAMAIQMDLMNRNMASMTHSMGSTMGRMGSWMP